LSAPDDSALLTILGAGTLFPDAARTSAAHHLRVGGESLLMDCGAGTVHGFARHGVRWQDVTHVAVSHFHNDHIGDLPALLFALRHGLGASRSSPLTILGPVGLAGLLDRLSAAFGGHVLDPGFETRVVEVEPGQALDAPGSALRIGCTRTPHTPESLAYRVEGPWGAIGYTGDCGPSESVADFLAGVDVLVAECDRPDAAATDNHLSPTSLAALARRATPGLLVVVHVNPLHTPEDVVREVGARYGGRVVAAVDGLRVRLRDGAPAVDVDPPAGPM